MSKIKESLSNKVIEILATLLVISLVGIWKIYQDDIVSLVQKKSPGSIYMLGWLILILTVFLLASVSLLIIQWKKYRDPFKNLLIDNKSRSAVDQKTNAHYCISCLGNYHKRFPMFQDRDVWLCSNNNCENSRSPIRGNQYLFG